MFLECQQCQLRPPAVAPTIQHVSMLICLHPPTTTQQSAPKAREEVVFPCQCLLSDGSDGAILVDWHLSFAQVLCLRDKLSEVRTDLRLSEWGASANYVRTGLYPWPFI